MDEKKYMKEHNYKVWEVKDIEELNWNNISYDGHGYVLTTDGSRYDSPNDEALYRQERQRWNELKVNNSIEKKSLPMLDPNIKASLRNFFSSTDVLIEQEIIRSSKYSADIA
ncbi:hypothetical protein PN465_08620 [Nodularia spumigena CS-584]|uniref:hypothetical protein n=1 Tax=Nodularia spumigena TaxID=70799 RepID=UPI00232C8414|nr:hypothetical protein [Nodularia spumigena]MDB9382285.1 hypothetical protein [Nodularia spumigena CS-584]